MTSATPLKYSEKRTGFDGSPKEVANMTENAKRAITYVVFAVGIILFIVGAVTTAYSTLTGVTIFFVFLAVSITLRTVWRLWRPR